MRLKDIKVGHSYTNTAGTTTRAVLAIGMDHRPGTALAAGILFNELRQRTAVNGTPFDTVKYQQRGYLDSFASWAKKEIKL